MNRQQFALAIGNIILSASEIDTMTAWDIPYHVLRLENEAAWTRFTNRKNGAGQQHAPEEKTEDLHTLLQSAAVKKWKSKRFAERVRIIIEAIKSKEEIGFGKLLIAMQKTENLIGIRNAIAHGTFIIDTDIEFRGNSDDQMTIGSITESKWGLINQETLIGSMLKMEALSKDISRIIAMHSMAAFHEKHQKTHAIQVGPSV